MSMLPSNGAETVCFRQTNRIGYFGLLSECVLLSKACVERGVEPYFFVSSPGSVHRGLSPNALSYYFEQVNIPKWMQRECRERINRGEFVDIHDRYDINRFARGDATLEIANDLTTIEEGRELFRRNLRTKRWIDNLVEKYWADYLQGLKVAGVHFRGTDKFGTESKPISHADVFAAMERALAEGFDQLFLATDDPVFSSEARRKFGKRCVDFSTPPGLPHYQDTQNNFRKGAVALIDCLLLSRCQLLIKTPSLLSAWCKVFNPDIKVQTIGRPYYSAYGEVERSGFGYWPEKCLHQDAYEPRLPMIRSLLLAWPRLRKLRKLYAMLESH